MGPDTPPLETTFQYVCVHCPKGCVVSVRIPEGADRSDIGQVTISGHKCKHGVEYAKQELVEPKRVLTTTVRVEGSDRMLPVRSSEPLPRERLLEVMRELDEVKVHLPIKSGQVVFKKILELDADIIATWSMET